MTLAPPSCKIFLSYATVPLFEYVPTFNSMPPASHHLEVCKILGSFGSDIRSPVSQLLRIILIGHHVPWLYFRRGADTTGAARKVGHDVAGNGSCQRLNACCYPRRSLRTHQSPWQFIGTTSLVEAPMTSTLITIIVRLLTNQ